MNSSSSVTRRQFLSTAGLASVALGLRANGAAPSSAANASALAPGELPPYSIITFSKPFQDIGFERTAAVLAEVGFRGIECPVRKKGQIEPERVEEDLPKMKEALNKQGLDLTLLTTDILRVDASTEKVLRTAHALGVRRYRLSYHKYDLTKPIPPQWDEIKAELRDLAALNKELGMIGGMQNHSGSSYVGAPIWDLFELLRELDPAHIGTCFDIGHATLEGGTSWPIEAKLMEPYLACVYVKDFQWIKGPKGFMPLWGPLGEGMVRPEFFSWLKKSSYRGPISLHCEYLKGAAPADIAQMKKDLAVLQSWL